MGHKAYGIDFGSNTIKVYRKGQGIVLTEKNIVSTVGKDKRPVAVGEDAYEMYERAPASIHVAFPIKRGIISDMDDMVALWNFAGKKLAGHRRFKGGDFYLSVPADITDVEKKAYERIITDSECKPKKVMLIPKPVADAYGLGLDVEQSSGILIANLGADTVEISVLSRGGIVVSKILPYGGNDYDDKIRNYVRKKYNFLIGKRTAEFVKTSLISAVPDDRVVKVVGRDVVKGLPGEITLSSTEINPLINDRFDDIAVAIRAVIERTPPEISHEITQRGVFVTGASSWINGIDDVIMRETGIGVNVSKDAQKTVASGLGFLAEHSKLAAKYAIKFK